MPDFFDGLKRGMFPRFFRMGAYMDIRKDYLFDNVFVYQNPSLYAFGTDAVLLAAFTRIRPGSVGMELCAGNGVISLMLAKRKKPSHITAVEIQEACADLAKMSVTENALEGIVTVLNADLKTLSPPHRKLDFVVVNPPYRKENAGFKSVEDSRRVSNAEVLCTLDDVVKTASLQLKYAGDFYCCHRPERLCDLFCSLRSFGMEPKRLVMVHPRPDTPPHLILCHAKKYSRPGLRVLSPLILLQDATGDVLSPQVQKIYKTGFF